MRAYAALNLYLQWSKIFHVFMFDCCLKHFVALYGFSSFQCEVTMRNSKMTDDLEHRMFIKISTWPQ